MIIKGDRIIIKSTEVDNLENIRNLWNNGEIMKWVGFPAGLNQSIKDVQKWWKKIKENDNVRTNMQQLLQQGQLPGSREQGQEAQCGHVPDQE